MATIAGGGPAASRSAMFGAALGEGAGNLFGTMAGQKLQQGQQQAAANPMRQAIGAATEGQVPQTVAQKLLRQAQEDPETFSRLFAEVGVGGLLEMAQAPDQSPEQFTLSPGEVRFQGSQPIAEVPDTREIAPSSAIAKLRQDLANGFITREEFSQERKNLMDTDEPVIAVADPDSSTGQRFVPRSKAAGMEAPGGGGDGVREQKIRDAMDQFGLPRGDAVALVDGVKRIEIVPETGRARLIDMRDESVREIAIGGEPGQSAPVPEGQEDQASVPAVQDFEQPEGGTLWDMAGVVTGPGAAMRRFISVPSGLMGLPVAERTTRATQAFNQTSQELVRSLAVNPRFPVAEMERIRNEIATLPKFLDNEKLLRVRMDELDRGLRRRAEQARQDAQDTALPDDVRNAQMANARNIESFLPVLGVPQVPEGMPRGSAPTGERTRSGGVVWEDPDGEKWVVE